MHGGRESGSAVSGSGARIDGLSPDVPHHTYCATSRELDVLLDVEDQIADECLVWIIREDALYTQAG